MKLQAWLELEGISAKDFGDRIGVSAEAVRLWADGERIPREKAMRAIARETKRQVEANDFYNSEAAA